ncbi:carboxymuconolactone decarboxylase family protein [Parachryseolinea silvisoli]|uniref:carboxymuconolactone decarboxylase family protein n=1 Tax=Parachryseolinea silvisoli TaxID=2873601 RepID=UPI00226583ED|nr:peroxidase-related enzyme [Parachryseolinea silvisoli]MCD9016624.1 peroxidase-related enzyme [Parachryseolinea silvisoli]
MAHIAVPEGIPGIRSLALYRPETAQHLYALAQVLLRDPSPLTPAERELIATHVSARNNCMFCMSSHAAAARELYADQQEIVDCVINQQDSPLLTAKMKALLTIAGKVQQNGKHVTDDDVRKAREHGATDRDIHDTVLIAAAFSMFNRYVDGLATLTPTDPREYEPMGKRLATQGYVPPQPA